jgi:hypothetical protein
VTRASLRADQLLAECDVEENALWHRMLAATEELQRGRQEGLPITEEFARNWRSPALTDGHHEFPVNAASRKAIST